MATITLRGKEIHTVGELPRVGSKAPDFTLTDKDLRDVGLSEWTRKKKILSIFPSIDTPVCALSTKKFNEYQRDHEDTVMLMISADLPFAHGRFCNSERLANVVSLSSMRNRDFAEDYGVLIEDGPLPDSWHAPSSCSTRTTLSSIHSSCPRSARSLTTRRP